MPPRNNLKLQIGRFWLTGAAPAGTCDASMGQTLSPLEDVLGQGATDMATMLRLLANEHRLLVLCTLIAEGEAEVGQLARRAGVSQPAMSQHLSRLREEGLVATRRTGTRIRYRVADPRVGTVIAFFRTLSGAPAGQPAAPQAAA